MELLVVKLLSGLVLWILSLCFGLMTPFLLWKSRSGNQESSRQQEHVRETENLLSNEETLHRYDSTNTRESTGRADSGTSCFARCRCSLLRYDIMSFINCCCGGLFLGVCLLELIPESREDVLAILNDLNIETSLPITEFLVSTGLLLVMVIEQSVNFMCVRRRTLKRSAYESISESPPNVEASTSSLRQNSAQSDEVASQVKVTIGTCSENGDEAENLIASEATRAIVLITMLSVHSIFEGLALGLEATVANLIQLLVAISVHKSVLSFGLGIRLFDTFTPNKVFVAVICTLIFCSASPLGCVIGVVLTLGTDNGSKPGSGDVTTVASTFFTQTSAATPVTGTMYATAIMECLAAGTFLYVTFVEVIPMEFSHSTGHHVTEEARPNTTACRPRKLPIPPFIKLFAFLFGFAIVTGLQFI